MPFLSGTKVFVLKEFNIEWNLDLPTTMCTANLLKPNQSTTTNTYHHSARFVSCEYLGILV